METTTQAESLHPPMLGADYERFCTAQVLMGVADRLVSEDVVPLPTQYKPLPRGLLALGRGGLSMTAVVDSYLLRGLASADWAAMTDTCVNYEVTR